MSSHIDGNFSKVPNTDYVHEKRDVSSQNTNITDNGGGGQFSTVDVKRHPSATINNDNIDHSAGGSIPSAIFNLIKTIVGAGIFTMPSGIFSGGFFFSIISIPVMGYLCNYTARLLVRTGVEDKVLDYEVLIKRSLGYWGYWLYLVTGFVYAFGICASYTVITADTIPTVIMSLSGHNYNYLYSDEASTVLKFFTDRRVIVVLVSVLIYYPISAPKYLKNMALSSILGVSMFAWVALTSIIVAWTLPDDSKSSSSASETYTFIKWDGVIGLLSKTAFAAVCHHNLFLIYRSIRNPTLMKYNFVANVSIAVSSILSVLFGVLGYIPLVEKARSGNILNNLPDDNIWVVIASMAFAIDVILTYPLELFVCRDILCKVIHGQDGYSNISTVRRHLYTASMVFLSLLVGVLVCNVNTVIDITGGLAASSIAFIFPAIAYISLKSKKKADFDYKSLSLMPKYAIILFGLFIAIGTVVTIIISVASEGGSGPTCTYLIL